jgi:hypothetical protein
MYSMMVALWRTSVNHDVVPTPFQDVLDLSKESDKKGESSG